MGGRGRLVAAPLLLNSPVVVLLLRVSATNDVRQLEIIKF